MEELIGYYKELYCFNEWSIAHNDSIETIDTPFFIRGKRLSPFQQASRCIFASTENDAFYTLAYDILDIENVRYRVMVTPFCTENCAKNGLLKRLLSPVPYTKEEHCVAGCPCFVSLSGTLPVLAFLTRKVVVQITPLTKECDVNQMYALAQKIEQQIWEA